MPPGDAIANAMLDVQFGGLEFGSDSSTLDTSTNQDTSNAAVVLASPSTMPAATVSTPTSVAASVASIMESFAAAQQPNLANPLTQVQKVSLLHLAVDDETLVAFLNCIRHSLIILKYKSIAYLYSNYWCLFKNTNTKIDYHDCMRGVTEAP